MLGEYDRQVVLAHPPNRSPWASSSPVPSARRLSTQRTRVLSPGEIANIPAGHALHLDGVQWELVTPHPGPRVEPWRTLTTALPRDEPDRRQPGRNRSRTGRSGWPGADVLGHLRAGQHRVRGVCRLLSATGCRCWDWGGRVLTVAKITEPAAGGYADYLEGKSAGQRELGDYYLKDGERVEAPGRWAAGADLFGLRRPSSRSPASSCATLMAVRRPDTGGELRRVGGSGEAVAAIDATFSAPKSVSARRGRSPTRELREQIERAHETAIDRALAYAVRQVPMLRRRVNDDTVVHEKAVGLVATSWRHTTARAVDDQVPDPQLHSHVLLHAAVRRDGRLVAIDSRSWLVHQREVGAAYRTELAHELNTARVHDRPRHGSRRALLRARRRSRRR